MTAQPAQTRLLIAVGLGAALGSVARALVSLGTVESLGPEFPWGTLTVNVLGSLLIGLYARLSEADGRCAAGPVTRHFVLAGFCGGFTTFSIFSLETLLLAEQGHLAMAGANIGLSVTLWLAAVWLGDRIGRHLNRPKPRPA